MAQSDLDNMKNGYRQSAAPAEADDQLVNFGESVNDTEARAAAQAAGVKRASFINYDVALDAYEARGDVEDGARRWARNGVGDHADFAEQSFMRTNSGNVGTGSAA